MAKRSPLYLFTKVGFGKKVRAPRSALRAPQKGDFNVKKLYI